jgi:phosphohistidine swiveling domain-containing protein
MVEYDKRTVEGPIEGWRVLYRAKDQFCGTPISPGRVFGRVAVIVVDPSDLKEYGKRHRKEVQKIRRRAGKYYDTHPFLRENYDFSREEYIRFCVKEIVGDEIFREKLEKHKNDIIVLRYLHPAYQLLGITCKALVKEVGGMTEHLANIMRELGIPYVVLPNATDVLKNGDLVEVDGYRGTVTTFEEIEFNLW